jgi:hypothetical protein
MPFPRRNINELIVRGRLAKFFTVVVEGPGDRRLLDLIKCEDHCSTKIKQIDFQCIDDIEVGPEILARHSIQTNGARQRVIAFSHEIADLDKDGALCAIIDLDLDVFLKRQINHSKLLYTDFGCLDIYLWSEEVVKNLAIQFKCESSVNGDRILSSLYRSIGVVCKAVASVRAIQMLHPEYDLQVHNSNKCLVFEDHTVLIDSCLFIDIAKAKNADRKSIDLLFLAYQKEFEDLNPLLVMNSHDLIWVLTFIFAKLTKGSRHHVNNEIVHSTLISHGIKRKDITSHDLFLALGSFATIGA